MYMLFLYIASMSPGFSAFWCFSFFNNQVNTLKPPSHGITQRPAPSQYLGSWGGVVLPMHETTGKKTPLAIRPLVLTSHCQLPITRSRPLPRLLESSPLSGSIVLYPLSLEVPSPDPYGCQWEDTEFLFYYGYGFID